MNDLETKLATATTGEVPHLKALVAIGVEWDMPDKQGGTPVQLAGWNGLPDVMAYFLKLAPDLGP